MAKPKMLNKWMRRIEPKVELEGATCEEASPLSIQMFIACGKPAVKIIWSNRDQKAYKMCEGCADHNVTNRSAIELVQKGR